MLEVRNISKSFPFKEGKLHAVRDVSFQVDKGEIFGIIGLSGAGKSTLLRCINALERPDEGEVLMNGVDLLKLPERELLEQRKDIGMIFQGFHLLMQKNALQNVMLPAYFHRSDLAQAKQRALEMLEVVGLTDKKDAYPAELSGGQKQRLAIARALVTQPKLLLSDEATSALDPQTTDSILRLIKEIVNKYQLSVVMITHQMEVAKEVCDRIAVMESGSFIEQGPVHDIFLRPKEKRTIEMIQGIQEDDKEPKPMVGEKLYRLTFDQPTATKPLISQAIRTFNIDVNILAGNIYQVQEDQLGTLYVEFLGEDERIDKALEYLSVNGVNWEVSE